MISSSINREDNDTSPSTESDLNGKSIDAVITYILVRKYSELKLP